MGIPWYLANSIFPLGPVLVMHIVKYSSNKILEQRDIISNDLFKKLSPENGVKASVTFSKLSQTPHEQLGGTCFANAAATIIRAAESRIIGRIPAPHEDIVR